MKMPRRGIFLDRDGVLCEDRSTYVKSWQEFRWLPTALEGMRRLAGVGLPVIMVTNQSAVNRGLTTADEVAGIHARMRAAIRKIRGRLDAIYVCPHRPDEACLCRKPGLLLFQQAAQEWRLDLRGSYIIGDSHGDLEAGWRLGMEVFLVRTGRGRETEALLDGTANFTVVADIVEAANSIQRRELAKTVASAGLPRVLPGRGARQGRQT